MGPLTYVGRRALATTAVGSSELHKKESAELAEWIKKVAKWGFDLNYNWDWF